MLKLILIAATICVSQADLYVKNCGSSNLIDFQKMEITPHPIKFPGKLNLDILAHVNRDVSGKIDVKVNIQKKILFWIPLLCFNNVGSCTYKDICSELDKLDCPPEVSSQGIQCKCPFHQGEFKFHMTDIDIPPIPTGLGFLAGGKYYAKATVFADGEEIGCVEAEVELDT